MSAASDVYKRQTNRKDIAKRFDDPAVAFSIQTDVDMLDAYDAAIRKLEKFLEQSAKVHDAKPTAGTSLASTVTPPGKVSSSESKF